MPDWWIRATGFAGIAVILACVVIIVATIYLIMVLSDVKRSVNSISERIQTLTERVDTVAKSVQEVTTEVGSRATGIVRMVDDIAVPAFQVVEKYAPYAIGAAVLFKLKQMYDKSR